MTTPMQLEVRQYVKAVVGGLLASLSLLAGALGDGLSNDEVIGVVVAFLTGFLGVFYAPNSESSRASLSGRSSAANKRPRSDGELGQSVVYFILAILGVLFVVFYLLPALTR